MKKNTLGFYALVIFSLFTLMACTKNEANAPDGFNIEDGLTMKLVASEPLIKDPVDLEFNEDGDALVLEMPGYPYEDQQSRIILLKDNDHDGIYDDNIIFAEGLQLASSILPFKGGVLVAAPPYLLHVIDTDDDDIADRTDTLMSGFSTGNLQHNYNGLTYGIDNWIYAANGGNSGQPYWWGDTTTVLDLRGEDFRFNLDRKQLERIGQSSGGFGLALNESEQLFETHNLEHISHLVFPQRYINGTPLSIPHTMTNISDHEENGLARIYPIGEQESRVNHPEQSGYFSGSCGITYYGGSSLGKKYDQTLWVADVVLNLIHVDKVEAKGASFKASRVMDQREVIASTDRSFRPVNMSVGPNGDLYVVDMYRGVIEHPEWIPDDIEATLDLNAGKKEGRIYKLNNKKVQNGAFNKANFESSKGLIASLSHPNQWIRNTAHRLLMEDELSQKEEEALSKNLSADNDMARLHSLWILDQQGRLSTSHLINSLNDKNEGIREKALIIAENNINTDDLILTKVIDLLTDINQRVRMQAALTISTLQVEIVEINMDSLLSKIAASTSMPTDQWNIAALSLSLKTIPSEAFQYFSDQQPKVPHHLLTSLSKIASKSQENIGIVLNTLSLSNIDVNTKSNIITAINNTISNNISSKPLINAIQRLESDSNRKLLSAMAGLRKKLSLPASTAFVTNSSEAILKIGDTNLNTEERLEQLSLIDLLPIDKKSQLLYSCLNNKEPMSIQEEALKQLGEADDPKIGYRLVEKWSELGPSARRYASDILLYKTAHHDALLTGLENGTINIGEMNFDLERRRTLLWWTDDENTKKRAEALFSDSGVVNRKDAIASMSEALDLDGSHTQGLEVYTSLCAQCHIYGNTGKDVGPVLTEINRKSKGQLINDILDPNAAADTKYINHKLETTDGALHIGIVDRETDQEVSIKKMGGISITIDKKDIKRLVSLGTSMMPEGLEGNMSQQDLADLLAFLQNSATL